MISEPPCLAEHSINVQGGSLEAANDLPSAVLTTLEYSWHMQLKMSRAVYTQGNETYFIYFVAYYHSNNISTTTTESRESVQLGYPTR